MPGWLGRILGKQPEEQPTHLTGVAGGGLRSLPRSPLASLERGTERRSAPSGPVLRPRLARVLIIDDEPQVAMGIRRLLYRHDVTIAHTGTQALALLRVQSFDAIVSDVMMPEPAGLDIYELLALEGSPLVERFVFVTGGHWGQRAREFLSRVPNQRLDKPVDPAALEQALSRVFPPWPVESVTEAG
jgi:CheY-like chemotaxis protein